MAEPPPVPPANTFVLRFWREGPPANRRWRGRIEHVQSGRRADFVDLERILAFVQGVGVMVDARSLRSQAGPSADVR